jgi:hypothetical protein
MMKMKTVIIFAMRAMLALIALGALAVVICTYMPHNFRLFETLSHLRLPLFALLLGMVCVLWVTRQRLLLIATSVALVVNAIPVLALYLPATQTRSATVEPLTVVVTNLWGARTSNISLQRKRSPIRIRI